VLSPEVLTANIKALIDAQGICPTLGALPSSVRITTPEAGLSAELRTPEGWCTIDSPAIAQSLEPFGTDGDERRDLTQVVMVGAGLGYAIDWLERVPAPVKILAIEPDPGLATLLLSRRDWRPHLTGASLRLLTGPDYRGANDVARFLDGLAGIAIIGHPVRVRHDPDAMARAMATAERVVQNARANGNARRQFAGPYLLQTLMNLRAIGREADIRRLDQAFAGVPAVVVGAGPSLDDNLSQLVAVQDRALIIAADTALGPLLAGGVRPHLAVGVDSSALNARHLTEHGDASDVMLAAEGSLHPTALARFAGRTFAFRVANHEPWPWLRAAGLTRGALHTWGSVLTSAFDLARRAGCDPIVFAGADLAFTGMRPYCRGTIYDAMWQAWIDRGCTWKQLMDDYFSRQPEVWLQGLEGQLTRTAPHLVSFRDWLVEQIAATPSVTCVNATGAGILNGPGIERTTILESVGSRPRLPDLRASLRTLHAAPAACTADQARLHRLLKKSRRSRTELPMDRWMQFTASTVTPDQIAEALGHSAT
jgi:hypothetical protein